MAFDINGAKEAGYSDAEIVGFLAPEKKFDVNAARKSGYNDSEILSFLSESDKKKPDEKESALRRAADLPVNFTKGVVSGVRMLTDAFGADNAISKSLRGVEDYVGNLLSAQAKNNQQEIARIMKDAQDKGVLDQVQDAFKAFAVAPVDIMSQAFGTIIPTLAGGLAGAGLKIGARAAGIGTGAVMGAGVGKSAIYDAVTEELTKAGLPKEAVEQAATQAQEYGGQNLDLILANTLLGGVAASTGIEKALIPGFAKNITQNLAKRGAFGRAGVTGGQEFLTEGLQGGTEQASQNIALQREGVDVPTFRGVAGAATMEGLAGGVMGGGVGAFSRPQAAPVAPPAAEPPPVQEFAPPVQEPVQVPMQEFAQEPEQFSTLAMPAIPQPMASTPMPLLSAEDARQQNYEQQVARQNAFQNNLDINQVVAPPIGQARAPVTEQDRLAMQLAAQQQMDADRFKQQTQPPVATPSQAIPRTPTQPLNAEQMRQRVDEQSALLGQMQTEPFEFDRRRLSTQADVAGGTGQVRGQPRAVIVDPNPMPPLQARQRLAVMKSDVEMSGGDPNSLSIVPHPTMGGRFAIEQRVTAQPYVAPPIETPTVSPAAAQQRIEGAALAGSEGQRLNQDQPRQAMLSRIMRNIEERGGVASPDEAEALRQANMGRPYNRIDYGLAPVKSVDQRLTEATGIDLERPRRETITQANQVAAREAAAETQARAAVEERQRVNEERRRMGLEQLAEDEQATAFLARRQAEAEQRVAQQQQQEQYQQRQAELQNVFGNLPPGPRDVIAALSTPSVNRDAQQIKTVKLAQERMTPNDFGILEMVADNPDSMPNALQRIENEYKVKYSLSNDPTPEAKATADDMRKKLLPILKRFGLGKVGLRLVDSIENGTADGMYAKQVITLALDSDNPLGVMRHEVIHALKELGAFTPAEWKVLTKAAKDTWINQFFNRDMQDRYQRVYLEQNSNLDGFPEYMQEEAIAQAFRFYTETKPPSGMIANLMRRLNAFFDALGNFLTGKGFTDIDEMFLPNRIFADIERGAVQPGRAGVRKEGLPEFAAKYSKRFSLSGDPTPMSVQKIRVYNKEIEDLTKKIGGRIAGMTSEQTLKDVRKAIKKLQSFTAKGLQGRQWYEQSAKAILDAFNGDKVLAEKLFQIIAITSAATEVSANFTKTVNAWNQFANGKPIKVGTGDTNKKIEALLYFGVDWDGRKTNTFYTNLLEAMEGTDTGRSTIDLHMTRMIFGKDQPTDAQYELAENMVRLLASKMNVPPRQVQAASWVTQKAKGMFEDYRKRGLKKNLNDKELREYAFERAVTDYSHLMKAKVTSLPITSELSEPSPDIRARTQTITGEVIPSVKTTMSQMEELAFADKEKLTKEVQKANTVSDIANALGIKSRIRVTVESGAYEGKVNPNLKVQLINDNLAVSESEAQELAYAMSYVFKQDATPFFRADPSLLNKEQYGISLRFDKSLTPAVQKKILGVMNQYLGADAGFSKVGPNEIVMINYRGDDGNPFLMPDADFITALAKARDDINQFAPIEDAKSFGAKSEYPYHDWQEDPVGTSILKRLQSSGAKRPYLQKRLNNLRESFVGIAREAVEKTGAEPRFSLRDFGPSQSALRPRPSSDAGISFNPVKEDAVSFQGSHYGKAKVEALNGAKYGQGLRGAEAKRLAQSDDERIKRRVYFYIPRSNNTMPNREAGVGGYVYTQKLDNILAPGATMTRLSREAGGDSNKFESLIVDNGYDGYAIPDFGMMVVMNQDVPVNYEGTVDEVHGGKKFSLRAPTTPEFKRFFGNSKVVNPDGTPKVMYHGTARIIDEFIPKQAGAIFVTENPEFASGFAEDSVRYMVREQIEKISEAYAKMTPADQVKFLQKAYRLGAKNNEISKNVAKANISTLDNDLESGRFADLSEAYFNEVSEFFRDSIREKLKSGENIMPLYVRAENPFDFENPAHVEQVYNRLFDRFGEEISFIKESLAKGNWPSIEDEAVQEIIKDLGHDSFYVIEGGNKNLAVYNPNQIKSAIGNRGTFDETGRILYSLKNAPPNQYTKLADDDPSTGKAMIDAATSAFNAVRNDGSRTSGRVALVDRYAGLSKSLQSLPLFNDGVLRADMLHHAKAQNINLIKGGLVTGTPILNDDGTIGIEASENNLARAAYLADDLNANKNVVESGLSGRGYVATIARGLRGADIIEEDKATRALGEQQISDANFLAGELKKELKEGKITPRQVAQFQNAIDELRKLGNENRKVNRELQVKPEDIAWAKKQLDMTPEVQDILDIWKTVNTSLVNLYEAVGTIDKQTADKYRAQKNYVPLFKSREDLNEEGFFRTGTGAKTTAKIKELKGADITRNIWENIDKQYATMIAAAYENQTRRVSVEQMRSISPDLAEITNQSDPRVNLRYRENGKDVHVVIENPNDLAAFQSMTYQMGPIMQIFSGFTKVLRAGALLNPMFWIRQLIRDPISATLTGQAGVITPFHSAKEFLTIITRNSEEARILASRGVIGQFDSTVSLQEFLGDVGKEKQNPPGVIQRGLHRLLEIHEASDAATRVAIFKKAKAKALADGMSESRAVDYAVMKARESINFAITGNSQFLAAARNMIPFLNATIVGLDTLYRAATGYGLNPEEKAKAQRMFATRASMMIAMSLAYAAMMQDDDDYKKLPDYVKDGNWLFPLSDKDGKTFVRVVVPYEVGYLFKTIPEVLVRYMSGTSTGKEALASLKAGFIQNMPTGGVPIPQFAKPTLEVISNHSFHTGRAIEGVGDSLMPVSERGRKASEFAKMMSKAGLDNIGMSPAKIDVFLKGTFAEMGTFGLELADSLILAGTGQDKTPKNFENMPFMRSFLTDPQVSKAVSDFYDLEKSATETANLFTRYKNEGRGEELQALVSDKEKLAQVQAAPVLRKLAQEMTKINKAINTIDNNKNIPPQERRDRINELQRVLATVAQQGYQVAGIAGLPR
jgi:hypothetical protein